MSSSSIANSHDRHLPPEIVATREISTNEIEIDVLVSADLPCFEGHFPDHPILPGVVQVDWAVTLGQQFFEITGEFAGLEAVKFMRITQPGQTITVALKWQSEKGKLHYRLLSDGIDHTSGRAVFSISAPKPECNDDVTNQ